MATEEVFVYGTLMSDRKNHRVIERAGGKLLGKATLTGGLEMRDVGAFPAIVWSPLGERLKIQGELYEVPEESIGALDLFEGAPDLYHRDMFRVALLNKKDTPLPKEPKPSEYTTHAAWERAWGKWHRKMRAAMPREYDAWAYVFTDTGRAELMPTIEAGEWTKERDGCDSLKGILPSD